MKRFASILVALALYASVAALAADTVSSGSWTKKEFGIAGGWSIVEDGGKHFVVLDGSFKTRNAPDLKLFLSKRDLSGANGKNATDDAILVAKLKSNKGAQRYELPDVDLAAYDTLLLHCEKYSKLWGGAPLR